MTTLRRTFRIAVSPEQALQFVRLKIADADNRAVTIEHAGTVLRRNGHLSTTRPLMMIVGPLVTAALMLLAWLRRDDDPEAMVFALASLGMAAGFSWPLATNHRRRSSHFAELADALQEVLAPLSDPEVAPIALRIAAEFHQ